MREPVVITGGGLVSPLGDSPELLHEALCSGRSAVGPVVGFDTASLPDIEAAEHRDFDPRAILDGNLRPLDRASMLTSAAATLALADTRLDPADNDGASIGLVLGTMFGSIHTISEFDRRALTAGPGYAKPLVFANTVINAAAGQTAIRLGLRGVNSTIAGGSVSGLQALGYAADLVASGRNDSVLAGGMEELSFEALLAFDRTGRLSGRGVGAPRAVPFDRGRHGFALGEAAALLVLESAGSARARDADVRGTILGCGQTFDPSRGADEASTIDAMHRAIILALANARTEVDQLGCVFASANGSVAGDRCEGRALVQALAGHRVPIAAILGMTGEALGASGALQAMAALEALRGDAVAGISGIERPEQGLEALDLDEGMRTPVGDAALVTGLGLDGAATALVLTAKGS